MADLKIVVIGSTGSGKSSLCNILSGQDSSEGDFPVSEKLSAGTFVTTCRRVKWLGSAPDLTIIDTPGLDDPQGKDSEHIADMVEKLKEIQHVNMFLVVFNAQRPRMDSSLAAMFRIFQGMFGSGFWDNTVILFSRWAFDSRSEKLRQKEKVTQESHGRMVNTFFREQLGVTKTIPCVYVDSCYQEDEDREVNAFRLESGKLLNILVSLPLYKCEDFEKVLSDMDKLREENEIARKDKEMAEVGLQHANIEKEKAEKEREAALDKERLANETLAREQENFAKSKEEAEKKIAKAEEERSRCQEEAEEAKIKAEKAKRRYEEELEESKRKDEDAKRQMKQHFESEVQKLETQAKLEKEARERKELEKELAIKAKEAEHQLEMARIKLEAAETKKVEEEKTSSQTNWDWVQPVGQLLGSAAVSFFKGKKEEKNRKKNLKGTSGKAPSDSQTKKTQSQTGT